MGYDRPKDYGFVQTTAPGGAAPAGPALVDWTDIDLTVAGFYLGFSAVGTAARWTITNPAAGVLRIHNTGNSNDNWWGDGTQTGPILIWPVQLDPRPDYPDPVGYGPNQWRSEDATIMAQITVADPAMGNLGPGGPNATGVGAGIGFVTMANTLGEGAAFIAAAPAPPYQTGSGGPQGASCYYSARVNGENNPAGTNWAFASVGNNLAGADGNFAGPLGTPGVVNTVQATMGQKYTQTGNDDRTVCFSSFTDNRVTVGGNLDRSSTQPNYGNLSRAEGRYVYVAIYGMNWSGDAHTQGSYIDVISARFLVQPLRNRSL